MFLEWCGVKPLNLVSFLSPWLIITLIFESLFIVGALQLFWIIITLSPSASILFHFPCHINSLLIVLRTLHQRAKHLSIILIFRIILKLHFKFFECFKNKILSLWLRDTFEGFNAPFTSNCVVFALACIYTDSTWGSFHSFLFHKKASTLQITLAIHACSWWRHSWGKGLIIFFLLLTLPWWASETQFTIWFFVSWSRIFNCISNLC